MRIDVDRTLGVPVIKEVYSGALIETSEGNRVGFCMRDDTVELHIMPANGPSNWYRVDMQSATMIVMPAKPASDFINNPAQGDGNG